MWFTVHLPATWRRRLTAKAAGWVLTNGIWQLRCQNRGHTRWLSLHYWQRLISLCNLIPFTEWEKRGEEKVLSHSHCHGRWQVKYFNVSACCIYITKKIRKQLHSMRHLVTSNFNKSSFIYYCHNPVAQQSIVPHVSLQSALHLPQNI